MRLVIRVGGSVVASPFRHVLINKYIEVLLELRRQEHEIIVVVGGGSFSRELIKIGRKLGLSEVAQDKVAISASRLVAQLFVLRLEEFGTLTVPTTIEDAVELLEKSSIVVMGGVKPGMTTDTVAAIIAERIAANLLVKATDQEGIFNKDPRKHKDAKKLDSLNFEALFNFFEKKRHEAGIHQILDPEAVRILQKNRTKTVVVNGNNPENVLFAVKGDKIGTVIL